MSPPSVVSTVEIGDVNSRPEDSSPHLNETLPTSDISQPQTTSALESDIKPEIVELEESTQILNSSQSDAHPSIPSPSSASTLTVADTTSVSSSSSEAPPPFVGGLDVPCMRGDLKLQDDGSYLISGTWAMTSASHGTEGHTSPFELRLPASALGNSSSPSSQSQYSGIYSGYFMLMQGDGKPPLKVDEKRVHLTYILNSAGGFNVQGTGKNRFGQFSMNGTVSVDNNVELFRAYLAKGEKPKVDGRKRGAPKIIPVVVSSSDSLGPTSGTGSPGALGGKSIQALSISIQKPVSEDSEVISPGRAKRANVGDWKSKADIAANREVNNSVVPAARKGKGKEHATTNIVNDIPDSDAPQKMGRVRRLPTHLQEVADDKPVRLNEHLRKCLTILREMIKNPSAHWFAQPVDWRFFGLLDYPKIIKEPMDFATIKNRVESGDISSAEDFKKAMFLVFRNAMTYNSKRDNIVHIAAKEMQTLFEEKYRTQVESIVTVVKEVEPAVDGRGRPGAGRGRKVGATGRGRKSAKGDDDAKSKGVGQNSGSSGGGGMVPQARFTALQQQMEMMQSQLETLKRQTSQTDLTMQAQMQLGSSSSSGGGGGGGRKIKELKPLSSHDKEMLKEGISGLPQDKLPRVLQIIKERVAHVGERGEDEIEVDLDTLDPTTLHELQRYVKSCAPRKRKKPTNSNQKQAEQTIPHQLPSPGFPDMDVDFSTLEEHALMDINVDNSKRGRNSFDPVLSAYDAIPFTHAELPEGLESDSDS
mmetsp:Transcript_12922/g.15438  ORF Transcript_12922/g.15438 Transcript_12922/m.15438 type:complete len:759 (-) Transcript_12922:146-2422(-)